MEVFVALNGDTGDIYAAWYSRLLLPNCSHTVCSLFILQFASFTANLILDIEIENMNGCMGHN